MFANWTLSKAAAHLVHEYCIKCHKEGSLIQDLSESRPSSSQRLVSYFSMSQHLCGFIHNHDPEGVGGKLGITSTSARAANDLHGTTI